MVAGRIYSSDAPLDPSSLVTGEPSRTNTTGSAVVVDAEGTPIGWDAYAETSQTSLEGPLSYPWVARSPHRDLWAGL